MSLTPHQIQTLKRFGVKKPESLTETKAVTEEVIEHHLWKTWNDFLNLCGQWRYQPAGFGVGIRVDLDAAAVTGYLNTVYGNRKQVKKKYQQIRLIVKGALVADQENFKKSKK